MSFTIMKMKRILVLGAMLVMSLLIAVPKAMAMDMHGHEMTFHHQHLMLRRRAERLQSIGNLFRRLEALDPNGKDVNLQPRETASEDLEEVAYRGPRRRGNHPNP